MLDRMINRAVLRQWRSAARQAKTAPAALLRARRSQARALRAELDQLIHVAEGRLSLPALGPDVFPRPHGTDWAWRPGLFRGPLAQPGMASVQTATPIAEDIMLFHDCRHNEIALRQFRNLHPGDLAPFGLCLDIFRFEGTFLSLAIDLPPDAAAGLSREHLLRVDATLECEADQQVYLRLNIRHGPNTEQVARALPPDGGAVEFDLAYCAFDETRVQALWLDVIFDAPAMNRAALRDLTLARHRRAPL